MATHPKSYLVMLSDDTAITLNFHNRSIGMRCPTFLAHPKSYLVMLSHESAIALNFHNCSTSMLFSTF